jgi:hypothetical protein
MGILSGNPKDEPMHYGEIYNVWQFSTMAKGALSSYQAYQNHAGDKDLKRLIDNVIEQTKNEIKECDVLLTANGIAPAPSLPDRPPVSLESIPVGARFSDMEIAAAISVQIAAGLVICSQIIGTSLREDIILLFVKYHGILLAFGEKMLRMNKEKGWLIPPPLQISRPETVTV